VGRVVRYFQETQDFAESVYMTSNRGDSTRLTALLWQIKVTSNLNVYASAAKGFRSGGFMDSTAALWP